MLFDPVRPRRVLAKELVAPDAFVLRFERRGDKVKAGRHVDVGLPGGPTRAYSLYSGEADPWLEILVRRVAGGQVSPQLAVLEAGDRLRVEPPRGRFTLSRAHPFERLLFLATGTGVAPFRSFLRTHPELDAVLVHGARHPGDDLAGEFCPDERRLLCVSEPPPGWVPNPRQRAGRLTAWLRDADLHRFDRVYLCGNARMIVDAVPILVDKGVEEAHIHTETYF